MKRYTVEIPEHLMCDLELAVAAELKRHERERTVASLDTDLRYHLGKMVHLETLAAILRQAELAPAGVAAVDVIDRLRKRIA